MKSIKLARRQCDTNPSTEVGMLGVWYKSVNFGCEFVQFGYKSFNFGYKVATFEAQMASRMEERLSSVRTVRLFLS